MTTFIAVIFGSYAIYYIGNILWDRRYAKKKDEEENVVLNFNDEDEEVTHIDTDEIVSDEEEEIEDIGQALGDNPVLPNNQAVTVDKYLDTVRAEAKEETAGIPFTN